MGPKFQGMGNEAAPIDPMTFYRQVCELAKVAFPDRKVGFSAGIAGYDDQWFPAIVEDGAFIIRPPDGRTIPIQNARDWRFRLTGKPFAEVLTFPNWPQCRN